MVNNPQIAEEQAKALALLNAVENADYIKKVTHEYIHFLKKIESACVELNRMLSSKTPSDIVECIKVFRVLH